MTARRCVILGDVVESRRLEDREAARERLEASVDAATRAGATGVVAPFDVLKGVDEIGGVLADPTRVVHVVRALVERFHPLELRLGVVWGDVDVDPDADDVTAMDGPAFHRADECLTAARDDGRYVRTSLAGVPDVFEAVLGDQLDLLSMWRYTWTDRQVAIVRAYRDAETMTAVGDEFDVSVQNVSKMIRRTHAKTVFAVEGTLADAFAAIDDGTFAVPDGDGFERSDGANHPRTDGGVGSW